MEFIGKFTALFYPEYKMPSFDTDMVIAVVCFVLMLSVPLIMDVYGEIRWKRAGQGV